MADSSRQRVARPTAAIIVMGSDRVAAEVGANAAMSLMVGSCRFLIWEPRRQAMARCQVHSMPFSILSCCLIAGPSLSMPVVPAAKGRAALTTVSDQINIAR